MPLPEKYFDLLIKKGQHPAIDSYSAFLDHQKNSNGLHEWLQQKKVTVVEIVGLATDVCVSETIRDAIYLKYEVIVDLNGCRGMENKIILKPYLNEK